MPCLRLHLKISVVVPHHPVVADNSHGFQMKDFLQLRGPRGRSMIVLGLRRVSPKPPIVFRQIGLLQKRVGLRMRLDFLQPHFLHQPILVGAVFSLHSTFRLCRIGSNDADPQPLAHLPKLRHRHHPLQLLLRARLAHIHILPIRIQRHRYAVFLDPCPQHSRRRPDRLLTPHPCQRISAGIVHHVHQTPSRPSFLQPGVETSIHLHQLAHMLFPLSPLAVQPALSRSTPQPFRQHPPPQRLRIHFHIIVARQVLGRQRRPEPLSFLPGILLAHQPQHSFPKFLRLPSVRLPPRASVLQPFGSLFSITLSHPLALAIAQPHHHRGVYQFQFAAFHSFQYPRSSHFLTAHRCPSQSGLLLWRPPD